MNKKFGLIVGSLLVWFIVIGSFAGYYIFISDSGVEQRETRKIKSIDESSNANSEEAVATNSLEMVNKNIIKPIDSEPSLDPKLPEISLDNKASNLFTIKKSKELGKENPEIKSDAVLQISVTKENPAKEELGGIVIQGHVIDLKTDKAIENVNVNFFTSEGQFLKRAVTDKNGRFESKGVKANAIHVRLQKERYISQVYKNYSLEELSEHLLFKMDPGLVINGIVKEKATNLAVVGVSVDMFRGNAILSKGETSDAQGNFKVYAVPLGSVELIFSKIGFSQASQSVNVENNSIPTLEILLEKSSALLIEVRILGEFVEIPKIRVYFDSNQEAKVYERSILTQNQGKNVYLIPGIDRAYSKLRIHADGFTFPAEQPLSITPGEETKVVFEVEKGMTVSGVIHGSKGNPLANVTLKLYEVFGGGRAIGDDVLKGTVATDKNGKFMISGITPGNIEIITSSTVYKRFQKRFVVDEKNNPEIVIVLEVESFFTGNVKNSNGELVNVHEIRFVPINADGTLDIKRDRPVFEGSATVGEFRMSGVTQGLYRLSITANGYTAFIEERYEVKNEQNTGEFILTKGLSITGDVKNKGGAPIVDVEVRIVASLKESNVNYRSRTDHNGFFAISGLEENITYKMQIQGKGYQLYEKEIIVKPDLAPFSVVLNNKLIYSGVVLDNHTQLPIQKFHIKIFGKVSRGLLDDSAEDFDVANGHFNIPVNSEEFNMELKAPGFAIYKLNNIKISDPIKNHYLLKAGSVNFKLLLSKDPAIMKLIQLSKSIDIESDESKRTGRTDSNGNVLIQNILPGKYYVRVSGVQGFANYDDVITVQEEVEIKKDIVMIPGLGVKGRVINSDSNIPVSSGEIYLDYDRYVKFPVKKYLSSDGYFEFSNVSVGYHSITLNYGAIANGKFSKSITYEITVPHSVNNNKGIYQLEDFLVK